jgi:GNAT superfamily N-acetyltransferase
LDLLLRSFDCRAEQIPMLYEVEAAAAAGQIWVARYAGGLAGLLFFETQGFSSLLRYWLVAPELRTQRLGSALMRRYLAEQPAVRRFLLWVAASNPEAIVKYEHFDFAREGLVDYVFANDRIRP